MTGSQRKDRDEGTMEKMGRSVGRSMGGLAGRAADAAAGMAGSMLASAADTLGGWWAEGAREAARSWDESRERRSRQHFEGSVKASGEADTGTGEVNADIRAEGHGEDRAGTRASRPSNYEEARPYYQLGHTARQHPEYESRDFGDVEPDLRRVAESGEHQQEWPDVRGYVQFGYEQGESDARS